MTSVRTATPVDLGGLCETLRRAWVTDGGDAAAIWRAPGAWKLWRDPR